MYRVTITKDGEEVTSFEHWSPESLGKMFSNLMYEEERKRGCIIDSRELDDQVKELDQVLAGGRILR